MVRELQPWHANISKRQVKAPKVYPRGKRMGFEFKRTDAPKISKSMAIAGEDLALDHLFVVYPGKESFALSKGVTALALRDVPVRVGRLA